jgi:hypothetical protein
MEYGTFKKYMKHCLYLLTTTLLQQRNSSKSPSHQTFNFEDYFLDYEDVPNTSFQFILKDRIFYSDKVVKYL